MSHIPEMQTTPPKPSFWRNLSPVWLVPILAVAISLGIAWRSYNDRGTLIEIIFQNAGGVVAKETAVRLRDVPIGMVEEVRFSADLSHVVVAARIAKEVAANIPENAQFWIVRPEVSARGISGLSTVLSGVYVETAFTPTAGADVRSFTGLEAAPLLSPGREGRRVTLRAADGNRLTPGAPVLYRGIQVGHIEAPRLIDGAEGVWVDAFIEAPYDARLTTAARFWDTSGFSVSFGTSGLRLGVGNLASILTGGIAFDSVSSFGEPLEEGAVFELYTDESTARSSVLTGVDANALRLTVEFDQSVQGLTSGSDVRYRGLVVGQVSGVSARVVADQGQVKVRMQAAIALNPEAMGLEPGSGPEELKDFLAEQVRNGLRARLAPARLIGSALVIELVDLPETEAAELREIPDGLPILPSVYANLPDFSATAQGLLERVNRLPIEGVMEQAISLMSAAEQLVSSDSTRAVPETARALLDEGRKLLSSEKIQQLPGEAVSVLSDIRAILTSFTEQDGTERLIAALQSVEEAATGLTEVAAEVPPVLTDLRGVLDKVRQLKAEELVEAATSLVEGADQFVRSDDTQALAPALSGALQEVQSVLAELRAGGTVENVNGTLSSARDAADAVALAAKDLPALAGRLDRLVAQAEALVGAYGARSPVNDELLSALREARATARAFSQLARAIERNPNSLLFGR